MVSSRYFFEVWGASCWNRTPKLVLRSTNFAGGDELVRESLTCALLAKVIAIAIVVALSRRQLIFVEEI
jgi:hypothetical protein